MAIRIDRATTSGGCGEHAVDGGTGSYAWIVGDDDECLVIDAGNGADAILDAIGHREVLAIVCTHGHADHIAGALEVAERTEASVLLHPDALEDWRKVHARLDPDGDLAHDQVFQVAGTQIRVIETPGHAPGSVCFAAPELGVVFTGDTLLAEGPHATGEAGSDRSTIEYSVRKLLFPLGDETIVKPGHGAETTIGAQREADWAL